MNMYLKGYSFGNKMFVVARNEDVYNELESRNADVMYITGNNILFRSTSNELTVDDRTKEKLNQLVDYDIVEISESGLLYRAFSNNEADTTIFLGAKCNSNCIMCPASDSERKNGFSYSRELLFKYIDYLPYELEYLIITGGEPTMQVELFLETLVRVRNKYPLTQMLLLTNGRSLSDEWLFNQVCNNKPNNFRIAIPIHAAGPEIHDKITQVKGSFDQTILALTRLMKTDIKIEIRIIVTKVNCDHLLEIAELIVQKFPRVFCVNFVGLEPRGNCAKNFNSVFIDYSSSFSKSKDAIKYLISHGYDVGLYNYPLCSIERDYWPIAAKSISGYKNVYHDDCNQCEVKQICGGFFLAAMNIAKPKVFPVKNKED